MKNFEKVKTVVEIIITITILIAIITSIFAKDWTTLFISSMALILIFLPYMFEKTYLINLPMEFELLFVLFIYGSLFLGEIHGYYEWFWWWDVILHTSSGILLGLIGFTIIFVLFESNKIKANPWIISIFAFSFALSIGAIWEIFEFGMDQIFNLNMQKPTRIDPSGLTDTMFDLIVDTLGALIISVLGYFYIKKEKSFFIEGLIKKFTEENPKLFRKSKRK